MGNLETEAQRIEAFKSVYGPQIETEDPRAGFARCGFELSWSDAGTGCQVRVNLENHSAREQLSLTRELAGHVLTLKVPRFDPEEWNDVIRGEWRKFANFPADYPVNFDFPDH